MKYFIFLFLFMGCSDVFAQSKKEVKKHNIKSCTVSVTVPDSATGKEKTFTDSYMAFDKSGQVIEEKEYDRNGKFRKHESHKYNKNNDETESIVYDENGSIARKTSTEYNSLNDKKSESIFNGKGALLEKTQFLYNPDGEKISEIVTDGQAKTISRSVFVYDNNGLKIERKTYNAAGQLVMIKKFSYQFH